VGNTRSSSLPPNGLEQKSTNPVALPLVGIDATGICRQIVAVTVARKLRRIVILSQILPANSTIGYDELAYLTVTKVNGKEIKSLDDLAEVVKYPIDGFIKIKNEEDPKQIELDTAQVAAEALALQENYGISSLQRLQ
jgi:hypothetical protein